MAQRVRASPRAIDRVVVFACFGGVIFFLLSIPLLRGRWRPRDASATRKSMRP